MNENTVASSMDVDTPDLDFDINGAWDTFTTTSAYGTTMSCDVLTKLIDDTMARPVVPGYCPAPSELRVSTKTKIAYISPCVDIYDIFWKIPITDYHIPVEGAVKKEMKYSSNTREELGELMRLCENESCVRFHIVKHIDKTTGNIRFHDVRKIVSGISKHDVKHKQAKPKGAFFNCIVVNIRINMSGIFKEYHVKIFNSGKVELPGTHGDGVYETVIDRVTTLLSSATGTTIDISKNNNTALVNSNFTCNFNLDRNVLMGIMKTTYGVVCSFDPCSYPGLRCSIKISNLIDRYGEFPADEAISDTDTMSCMIFRTGSVLLVGKCTDIVLTTLYRYICDILRDEYPKIASA
jgi:TATA-box binding protein (TBP) (component of TFIID and TFIIIB)